MRRFALTLLLAGLLSPIPAGATTLQVVAPEAGATLHGGAFATLQWTADELPRGSEEWEAFLSIDGGRYYAFRITPHLDIALRRFTFIVPNVDTTNARILIRTGDEVHESRFELPAAVSIVRDTWVTMPYPGVVSRGRAEAARDGDPAVVAWTDGDRAGTHLSVQFELPTVLPATIRSAVRLREAAPLLPPKALHSQIAAGVTHARSEKPSPNWLPLGESTPSADLLLICRRRNI